MHCNYVVAAAICRSWGHLRGLRESLWKSSELPRFNISVNGGHGNSCCITLLPRQNHHHVRENKVYFSSMNFTSQRCQKLWLWELVRLLTWCRAELNPKSGYLPKQSHHQSLHSHGLFLWQILCTCDFFNMWGACTVPTQTSKCLLNKYNSHVTHTHLIRGNAALYLASKTKCKIRKNIQDKDLLSSYNTYIRYRGV